MENGDKKTVLLVTVSMLELTSFGASSRTDIVMAERYKKKDYSRFLI